MRPASVVGWRSDALSPTASNLFLRLSRILPTKTAGFLVAVFTNEDRMSLRLFCKSSPNIYALHDISLSYAHESEKALSLKTKVTGDKTTGKGPGVGANRQELYTRQQTKSWLSCSLASLEQLDNLVDVRADPLPSSISSCTIYKHDTASVVRQSQTLADFHRGSGGDFLRRKTPRIWAPPSEDLDPPYTISGRSWYSIKRPRRDARLSWPSWLVTCRRRSPIQLPVLYNRARCALTSFIRRTPLTTMPRRHRLVIHRYQCRINANRGPWQLFARGPLLTRDKDLSIN